MAVLELSLGVPPGSFELINLGIAELTKSHGSSRRLGALVALRGRVSDDFVKEVNSDEVFQLFRSHLLKIEPKIRTPAGVVTCQSGEYSK